MRRNRIWFKGKKASCKGFVKSKTSLFEKTKRGSHGQQQWDQDKINSFLIGFAQLPTQQQDLLYDIFDLAESEKKQDIAARMQIDKRQLERWLAKFYFGVQLSSLLDSDFRRAFNDARKQNIFSSVSTTSEAQKRPREDDEDTLARKRQKTDTVSSTDQDVGTHNQAHFIVPTSTTTTTTSSVQPVLTPEQIEITAINNARLSFNNNDQCCQSAFEKLAKARGFDTLEKYQISLMGMGIILTLYYEYDSQQRQIMRADLINLNQAKRQRMDSIYGVLSGLPALCDKIDQNNAALKILFQEKTLTDALQSQFEKIGLDIKMNYDSRNKVWIAASPQAKMNNTNDNLVNTTTPQRPSSSVSTSNPTLFSHPHVIIPTPQRVTSTSSSPNPGEITELPTPKR